MLKFRQATMTADGKPFSLTPGKINSFDHFYVDFQQHTTGAVKKWSVFLHTKQPLAVKKISVEFDLSAAAFSSISTIGWQSDSPAHRYPIQARMPAGHDLIPGDGTFRFLPSGTNLFHSWSRMILHGNIDDVLVGSLNESTGFTHFIYDATTEVLSIQKDLGPDGMEFRHSFPLLDFCCINGEEEEILDGYIKLLELPAATKHKTWIWSTAGISDNKTVESITAQLKNSGLPFSGIMLDDGWAVPGDWISGQILPAADVAANARKCGLDTYISISPFLADIKSKTAVQHPDWLLKNSKGQPLKFGNQSFILDPYHPGVRDSLSGFFHIANEKWQIHGYYLDHLHLVCAATPPDKTRGQVMSDTLDFLRQLTARRTTIVAQVPPGSALGKFGAVAIPEPNNVRAIRTALSMQDFRGAGYALSSKNGPLEKVKSEPEGNKQYSKLMLGALLSDIFILRGNFESLPPEIRTELDEAAFWSSARPDAIKWPDKLMLRLKIKHDGEQRMAYANFSAKKKTFYENQTSIDLRPFETLTF